MESQQIPATSKHFDLPDEMVVKIRPWDIEDEMLVGVPQRDNSFLVSDDPEHCLVNLLDESEETGELYQYDNLRDVPVWQFICHHYLADSVHIEMPNIEKYGTIEEATDRGAMEMVKNLFLTPDDGFYCTPEDRGDDGSAWAFITLKRRP